ncbi:hypothetical protein ACJJIF_01865 [Microbulbifer sp. SSSA002]|uniref:hypothetical protein n=1 Tax=unclassified Microbulbifer TaxID=2619833 RepID=UPI00403A316C
MGGAVAQAQTPLTAEKNRLARLEQSLENRSVGLEDVENELLSYEYKLEQAQKSLDELRLEYEASRQELNQATRAHESSSNSDSERRLKKAKHAFAMAERGVDSRSRRLDFIRENYQQLQQKLVEEKQAVADTKLKISVQQDRISRMVEDMLAKAEASERRAALARAAAATEKPKPPVVRAQVEPPKPKEPVKKPVKEEVVVKRAIDPDLLDYVREEKQRLDTLLADKEGNDRQTFRSLELRPVGGERIPFEFLGENQYRLVTTVESGRETYRINTWKFRRTIPAEDDGVRYVFIFDARRLSRPRLVMYPEYVLAELN